MKLTYLILLFTATIIVFFTNCKKEDSLIKDTVPEITVPDLETLSAIVYEDGGFTLEGRINKLSANFRQYGFIMATDSLFRMNVHIFGQSVIPPIGIFRQDVFSNIEKDKKYFFSAYRMDDSLRYHLFNIKSFTATGAKKIQVDSIFPLTVHFGDTVNIYGRYFNGKSLKLNIGNFSTYLSDTSDSLLRFIVPDLESVSPILSISYDNYLDTITENFALYKPAISGFTNHLSFRDTMVIRGEHFDFRPNKNVVKFGNLTAEVINSTRSELKVRVPDNITSSESTVSVTSMLYERVASSKFILRKPELNWFPLSGHAHETIKLKGKYFHPVPQKNVVYCEGIKVEIIGGNTSELEIRIPAGPFPRKRASISYELLEYHLDWGSDFKLNDTWIMVNDQIPFNVYMPIGTVTLNNTAYVISRSKNIYDNVNYIWKFRPENYSWQQIKIPFNFTNGVVVASSDRIYLYIKSKKDNFWEYNPTTNAWLQKADFLFEERNSPSIFHLSNSVYLGIGSESTPFSQTALHTFYKYDIKKNTWSRVSDFPTSVGNSIRKEAACFVLNNNAYIGCGASNTGMYDFYRYDPIADSWSRIADFPDARNYTASFTMHNKGYVVHGTPVGGSARADCFRYDSVADNWTKMSDIGVSRGIERSYAFSINGKAYSGGGSSSSSQYTLYESLEP